MPIDTRERRAWRRAPGLPGRGGGPAERPGAGQDLLRRLRVRHFSGELLDAPETIDAAAVNAGIDPGDLRRWCGEEATGAALAEDMAAARRPMPAARVLDEKLANWSGGRRYTCPSYEIVRLADDVRISVPGFQPFAVYDVVTANLVPGLERRDPASSAEEVLRWAGTPLASVEVAVVRDQPLKDAREELGRVARERHVGADGFWTLPD